MKKALFPISYLLILLIPGNIEELFAGPQTARERLVQAERYVAEGEIDFAFMEYRALLEEESEGPMAEEAMFAIGEYYFQQRNTAETKHSFSAFRQKSTEEIPTLLASVYLLQCARLSGDTETAHRLERHLKERLSSKELFLFFEENRAQEWTSPLGNRFGLREFVDRLEITLNGRPFYEITLP